MRLVLFALLTVLPLIEIALLVKFGQLVGVWLTLVVVVGTAILGAGILQRQGFTTMMRTQEAMMRGEPPVGAMMDGAMMVMAGFFLILPGLITDTMGLLLLILSGISWRDASLRACSAGPTCMWKCSSVRAAKSADPGAVAVASRMAAPSSKAISSASTSARSIRATRIVRAIKADHVPPSAGGAPAF